MLDWVHDFIGFEKSFSGDTGDIVSGAGKHVRYGTNDNITEYLAQAKNGWTGGANLPEVAFLLQTASAYLGGPATGVLGYLGVVGDGLASHRKMVEVAAAEYGNNEVYGQKEFDKIDERILHKTGVELLHPGMYVDTYLSIAAEDDVAKRSTLPTADSPPASDWGDIGYPEVLWTIFGVRPEPLKHLATGFGVIGKHLLTYSSRLQKRVGQVTNPKIWSGDAADAFELASDKAVRSMADWSSKLHTLSQTLGRAAEAISSAQETAEGELTKFRTDIDNLTIEYNNRIAYARAHGNQWIDNDQSGHTEQDLIYGYHSEVDRIQHFFTKRLREIGRGMSEGIVANSVWRPLPDAYSGIMLEAALKPVKPTERKPTKPPSNGPTNTGPTAGPRVKPPNTKTQKPPNTQWVPGEGWIPGPPIDPNEVAAAVAAAMAAAAAAAAKNPDKNKNNNAPSTDGTAIEHGTGKGNPFAEGTKIGGNLDGSPYTGGPFGNTGANNGTNGSTNNGTTGGVTAPSIPNLGGGSTNGNTGTTGGGIVVPTIPTFPTAPGSSNGSTNGGGGGGGGGGITVPTIPSTGTGSTPSPSGGGGNPPVTVPITPGSGTGNTNNANRPDWWDDNPWDKPDSPVSLDGRNADPGGGGGGGGGGSPVTPIPPGDAGPAGTAATTIGTNAGAVGAEQTPYLPPMMPPMGGAGGGGGGGGPRPVRRGGPKLVDPGVGNGPAALSGRGKDANEAKPQVVSTEADGWTVPSQPEKEEQPVTRVLGSA
ncbi:MAG: WXG100 family type VII secretion target [Hamadaea sp.]|uniref:WXG100 family type VII secretion target n=1 Tax=Hamadaea sp. TaxID=2024425 RepID=UPI0017ACCEA9|nr:WXG100 family type VII secretion target [Hamadaea sp.]NUT20403.1 WXG100 family type VII secretion target [Hamadaea sp.]